VGDVQNVSSVPHLHERLREFLWAHVVAAPEMRVWIRLDETSPDRVEFQRLAIHPVSAGAVDQAKALIEELSSGR